MNDHGLGTGEGTEHKRQPNSSGCFVCGLSNPIGLKIVFEEDHEQGEVHARLRVPAPDGAPEVPGTPTARP